MKKTKRMLITALASSMLFSLVSCNPVSESGAGESKAIKKWTAGYGQVELIPPEIDSKTYYMAGYSVDKKITGVLDYQTVKAIWLDDNSGNGGIVIAAVDCIGLTGSEVERIRNMLADFQTETGCRSINIISTHTHAGIDTLGLWGPIGIDGKSPEFMQVIYDGAVKAVKQAYDSRRDGKLYYGSGIIEGLQEDSRPPYVFDTKLHSLRFAPDNSTDSNGIRILNYAAHAEALRSQNTLLSADYPAYLTKHVKQNSGDDVMFIPAAIGGLIMTKRLTGDDGESLPDIERTEKTGRMIGEAALGISNERELEPELSVNNKEVVIPMDNDLYVLGKSLGILDSKTLPNGGRHNISIVTEVGLLEIGGLPVCLVPGELFPELAYGGATVNPEANPQALSEIIETDFLVFGLCNDEIGYIVPPGDYFLHESEPYFNEGIDATGRKHYEETNSVGPLAAELIINSLTELIESK